MQARGSVTRPSALRSVYNPGRLPSPCGSLDEGQLGQVSEATSLPRGCGPRQLLAGARARLAWKGRGGSRSPRAAGLMRGTGNDHWDAGENGPISVSLGAAFETMGSEVLGGSSQQCPDESAIEAKRQTMEGKRPSRSPPPSLIGPRDSTSPAGPATAGPAPLEPIAGPPAPWQWTPVVTARCFSRKSPKSIDLSEVPGTPPRHRSGDACRSQNTPI